MDTCSCWRGWWRYVLTDQIYVWAPGCFMGMALPALMSIHFAPFSHLQETGLAWAQAIKRRRFCASRSAGRAGIRAIPSRTFRAR